MFKFSKKSFNQFEMVEFQFDNEIKPSDLKTLFPPDAVKDGFAHKGVVLSGRGPVWLYCFLTHFYHTTKFVATYDPRLQGAVIVESHGSEYKVGDIIPVDSSLITTNA